MHNVTVLVDDLFHLITRIIVAVVILLVTVILLYPFD